MTITLSAWAIPAIVTLSVILWAILMPFPPQRGDYDFSAVFTGIFRIAAVVIVTLIAWLIYFMVY